MITVPPNPSLEPHWLMTAMLGLLLTGCAGISTAPTTEAWQALAPTGKLRVGLQLGNPFQHFDAKYVVGVSNLLNDNGAFLSLVPRPQASSRNVRRLNTLIAQ